MVEGEAMTPQEKLDALGEDFFRFASDCARHHLNSLKRSLCTKSERFLEDCCMNSCPRLNRPHDTKADS